MIERQARAIETIVFVAVILAAQLLQGCAALMVQATPQWVNATYVRVGDQDLSGLEIDSNETGAFRVRVQEQHATGQVLPDTVRATMEVLP